MRGTTYNTRTIKRSKIRRGGLGISTTAHLRPVRHKAHVIQASARKSHSETQVRERTFPPAQSTAAPSTPQTHEDGGGCPVVREGDATLSAQTTGHSRPRRLLSMPAIHEMSDNMHRNKHHGGEPVPGSIRDCLASRRWVATNNVEQSRLPHPTHTDEDGGGCPVVREGDATSSAQMTGHSRPRRLHSMPAIHEKSNNMHPDLHRGGEPVPGNIRDCLASRRWVATNNVEQTRLPHPTHTDEDGGGCPVVTEGDATSSAQTTGHSRPRRFLSTPATHEKSHGNHPGKRRGGEPAPGKTRDCRATRRWAPSVACERVSILTRPAA